MNVSAKVDTKQLQKQLKKISTMGTPQQKETALQGALLLIIEEAVKNLRKLGLWVTGTLASSITSETRIGNNKVEGRVGTNLVYARIHELGGIIRAKKAPYLWFKVKDGTYRKVKQVSIKARPYLRPAYITKLQEVINTLAANLRKILENSI